MMTSHVHVAIIGGGIVGASVLYALARAGWTDTLLLEKRELTSGSTWHAAGNVTHFGHYPSITRLYVDSLNLYREAAEKTGQEIGFHKTGSLRLATTEHELDAYKRIEPLYDDLDAGYRIVSPEEISELHPLLNIEGLYGAAHTPDDGHVDPSGSTHALARAARDLGASIKRHCPVTGLEHSKQGWKLQTPDGLVIAEHVVVAASFWSRELLEPLGLNLPLYPLEHHELITGEVAGLAGLGHEVPAVRDPVAPSNVRQEGAGFLCGVYESDPKFWAVDGIPPDFAEELLPPDMDRLEDHLMRVIERLPAFGEAGIKTVNNGPICYTPDGCPMLGPVEGHRGLWLATGFAIGIGTGGGSAQFLARWMMEGAPPSDLPIVYPSRFPKDLTRETALRRIHATYAAGYVTPDV